VLAVIVFGRPGSERVDADELPHAYHSLRRAAQILAERQIVSIAHHKPVRLIEIRKRFVPSDRLYSLRTLTLLLNPSEACDCSSIDLPNV